MEAQNGLTVKKLTKHSLERAAERGIDTSAIEDSLKNPLHIGDVTTDEFGRKSQRFVGKTATVNVNPDTGEIVTIWKTGEWYYKQYVKGK